MTAHLAAYCHKIGERCVVIDADPQGSVSLWHSLRADGQPPLMSGARGIERALTSAMVDGYKWAFIDTAASMWVVAQEAIRAAISSSFRRGRDFSISTPCARRSRPRARATSPTPSCSTRTPPKRGEKEAPAVAQSRAFFDKLGIPVWAGQISQRAGYVLTLAAGASICESTPDSVATSEVARLWTAVERSVGAIHDAHTAAATQGQAA